MTTVQHLVGTSLSAVWGLKTTDLSKRTQVLMFHSIGGKAMGDIQGRYSIDPDNFRSQMKMLKTMDGNGVNIVPFGQFAPRSLSITFDDGYKDNLTIAAPILAKLEIPFHIFLCPTFIDSNSEEFLTRLDVQRLCQSSNSTFGVHGFSHRPLTALDPSEALAELQLSFDWLKDLSGESIPTVSYPHGAVDSNVREMVKHVGFHLAASSKFGPLSIPQDPFSIPRIDVWSTDTPTTLKAKIAGKWDWMKWRT